MEHLDLLKGFSKILKSLDHPIPSGVHFLLDRFDDPRGREFFKIPLKMCRSVTLSGLYQQVHMAGHQAPGIYDDPLRIDKMVQCIHDDLLIGGTDEYVYPIDHIEREKKTGIPRIYGLAVMQHEQRF
jgi:hypothetical protein